MSAPVLIASSVDAELYEWPDGAWVVKVRTGRRFVVDRLFTTAASVDAAGFERGAL